MVSIAQCQDIEVLRQIALLQERELRTMQDRIQALGRRLAQLEGKDATAAQVELELLKELLAQRTQALFGDSSEKRPRTLPSGELKPPRRGHGPRAQLSLPVLALVHDLPEGERTCPECGGVLCEMAGQFEESEEITVVERAFQLVKHQRRKYRCACNGCVVTAPGPLKLQPGGRYAVEFAVEVAVAKYLDHLPLERQRRIMAACLASPAAADRVATVVPDLTPVMFADSGETVLRVEIPDLSLEEGEGVDAAWLEYRVDLAVGSEVQAWWAADTTEAPWAREDGSREGLVDLWVTDERTEDFVRLDVTKAVRRMVGGDPAAPVLLLRTVGPDMEPAAVAAEGVSEDIVKVRFREDAAQQ